MASDILKQVERARKAGYSVDEIADYVASQKGIDIGAARSSGYTSDDIIQELAFPGTTDKGTTRNPYQEAMAGRSSPERAMINIGSGMKSLYTGARQLAGMPQSASDATDIEAGKYLSEQPGGTVGRIVGQALPFAAIPAGSVAQGAGRALQAAGMAGRALPGSGAAVKAGTAIAGSTMADVAGTGALAGAFLPTTQEGERGTNVAIGAAAGPVGVGAMRAAGAAGQLGKVWLNPERVAAEGLLDVATDPAAVRAALARGGYQIVPGSIPTTATLSGDAGLLQMQRGMMGKPEWATHGAPLAEQSAKARMEQLAKVAGSPDDLRAAESARREMADMLYEPLKNARVQLDQEMVGIMDRPVVKKAMNRAVTIAANRGESITADGLMSGRGLQYVKMALDDIVKDPRVQQAEGIVGQELGALSDARKAFTSWANKNVPGYQDANRAYAEASRPISQMKAGQQIEQKISEKAGQTASGVSTPTALQFEKAFRDAAVDKKYGANFSPEAYKALEAISKDLRRSDLVNATNVRGVNSSTFEKFASQSVAGKILGGNSELAKRVQNLPMFSGRNQEVGEMLVRAIADPRYANMIVSALPKASDQSAMRNLIMQVGRQAGIASAPAATREVRQ